MPELTCACASARRAARLITQLYASEIGPGIEPSQFALLSALSQEAAMTQSTLGRALGLDKTTVSRNLRLMQKNGWIEPAPTNTQRGRSYRGTRAGKKVLATAKPGWLRAQRRLRDALPAEQWEQIHHVFRLVAEAARRA